MLPDTRMRRLVRSMGQWTKRGWTFNLRDTTLKRPSYEDTQLLIRYAYEGPPLNNTDPREARWHGCYVPDASYRSTMTRWAKRLYPKGQPRRKAA